MAAVLQEYEDTFAADNNAPPAKKPRPALPNPLKAPSKAPLFDDDEPDEEEKRRQEEALKAKYVFFYVVILSYL